MTRQHADNFVEVFLFYCYMSVWREKTYPRFIKVAQSEIKYFTFLTDGKNRKFPKPLIAYSYIIGGASNCKILNLY